MVNMTPYVNARKHIPLDQTFREEKPVAVKSFIIWNTYVHFEHVHSTGTAAQFM